MGGGRGRDRGWGVGRDWGWGGSLYHHRGYDDLLGRRENGRHHRLRRDGRHDWRWNRHCNGCGRYRSLSRHGGQRRWGDLRRGRRHRWLLWLRCCSRGTRRSRHSDSWRRLDCRDVGRHRHQNLQFAQYVTQSYASMRVMLMIVRCSIKVQNCTHGLASNDAPVMAARKRALVLTCCAGVGAATVIGFAIGPGAVGSAAHTMYSITLCRGYGDESWPHQHALKQTCFSLTPT